MPYALTGVTKRYGKHTVLDGLTHHFPDTGLVAVTGVSGRGKTTLLRLIAGLEKPDSGSIRFDARMAMAFQEYRLFPALSALENAAAMAPRADMPRVRAQAKALLTRLGFTQESLDRRPGALSGGMKQRVSLVRALCGNAQVILLDEPLKELDEALRREVLAVIEKKSHEALIIMTVHDISSLEGIQAEVLHLG